MPLPSRVFFTAFVLCLTARAACVNSAELTQITGAAGSKFLVDVTGKNDFALPTLLLFNPGGCLAWTQLGLDDPTWKSSVDDALKSAPTLNCANPTLSLAIGQLVSEGVDIPADELHERHVLVWYGSDQLCAPCAQMKLDVLPALQASLPDDTLMILLDWK